LEIDSGLAFAAAEFSVSQAIEGPGTVRREAVKVWGEPARPAINRPPPSPAAEAALQAAARFYNATAVGEVDECLPPATICVTYGHGADAPDLGVAAVAVFEPEFGGAIAFFGLQGNGMWGYWFATQNDYYQATVLPAQMRVCADGQGVNVREDADTASSSLGLLRDGTLVTAESFVLTQPGTNNPGTVGLGWYAVSGAMRGFIRSDLLSKATEPDCSLRDIQVR
jgi:hypothetical protein